MLRRLCKHSPDAGRQLEEDLTRPTQTVAGGDRADEGGATDVPRRRRVDVQAYRRADARADVHRRTQTYRRTDIHRHTQTYKDAFRRIQTYMQTYRRADIQTYRSADVQTYTNVQTYRRIDGKGVEG